MALKIQHRNYIIIYNIINIGLINMCNNVRSSYYKSDIKLSEQLLKLFKIQYCQ